MPWWLKPGSRGFTPAFITGSTLRRGRNSAATSRGLRARSIGPEVRRWRCDEKGWRKAARGVGLYTRSRRLSTVSEPPRVAHEEQDLGEIAGADQAAGLDHLSRCQALGHSDRRAERECVRAPLERHAGIDENDIAGAAKSVVAADQVIIRDSVNAPTEAHGHATLREQTVAQADAPRVH